MPALVAKLDSRLTGYQEFVGSIPPGRQHTFVKVDLEIFSTVILSLM